MQPLIWFLCSVLFFAAPLFAQTDSLRNCGNSTIEDYSGYPGAKGERIPGRPEGRGAK